MLKQKQHFTIRFCIIDTFSSFYWDPSNETKYIHHIMNSFLVSINMKKVQSGMHLVKNLKSKWEKKYLINIKYCFFGWVVHSGEQVINNMVNDRWGKVGRYSVESITTVFSLDPWLFARISKLCTFHYGIVWGISPHFIRLGNLVIFNTITTKLST